MNHKVSIVIPAYNAETTIESTVQSVIRQTEKDLEVIVVDDLSSDSTKEIVAELSRQDPRVKLIQQARNEGPGQARNSGLAQASGQWVGFVDADDWIAPNRIELLLEIGESQGADIVYDNQYYVAGASMKPWRTLFMPPDVDYQPLSLEDLVRNDTVGRTGNFGHLKPLIARRFLVDNKISFPTSLMLGEDFSFHFRCLAAGARAVLVSAPLYFYRIHENSLSARHEVDPLSDLVEELQRLEEVLPPADNGRMRKLLASKRSDTIKYLNYKIFLRDLAHFDMIGAAGHLAKSPATIWLCIRQLVAKVRRLARTRLIPSGH